MFKVSLVVFILFRVIFLPKTIDKYKWFIIIRGSTRNIYIYIYIYIYKYSSFVKSIKILKRKLWLTVEGMGRLRRKQEFKDGKG